MSKLIPVRRLNKHGVMCTKWVLPESSGQSSSAIPAPAVAATVRPFDVRNTEINAMFHEHRIRHSGHTIQEFDQGAVQAVEWMVKSSHDNGMHWNALNVVNRTLDAVNFDFQLPRGTRSSFLPFNNLAVFGDALIHPDTNTFAFEQLVAGLRQFPEYMDFLSEATDKEREQAVALLTVAARIEPEFKVVQEHKWGPDCVVIKSQDLIDLVMEHPESAEDIINLMQERGTDDASILRTVIEFDQQALREGIL